MAIIIGRVSSELQSDPDSTSPPKPNVGPSFFSRLTRVKTEEQIIGDIDSAEASGKNLKRVLPWLFVVLFGLSNTVGSGVFKSPGEAAPIAGPALCFSFLLGGLACVLSGVCYVDFASRLPASGGAYSFVYSSLGEYAAFLTGLALTLEYGVSSAAISTGFSDYLRQLIAMIRLGGMTDNLEIGIPAWMGPFEWDSLPFLRVDPIAGFLCLGVALLCARGVMESSRIGAGVTIFSVSMVTLFAIVGIASKNNEYLTENFAPRGFQGVLEGTAKIFFCFIGWDAICVLAEEVKDPKRTIPIAITVSIGIVSALYFSVCIAFFGLWKYTTDAAELSKMQAAPLVYAFSGQDGLKNWMPYLVGIAAIMCSANATFGTTQGQPRVFYCMARDGLLPEKFASVEKTSMVPKVAIFATACITIPLALFVKFKYLEGTIVSGILMLQAFVCLGCLVRRAQLGQVQNLSRLYNGLGVFCLLSFLTAAVFVHFSSVIATASIGAACILAGATCVFFMGHCWSEAIIPLSGVFINVAFIGSREYLALVGLLGTIAVVTIYYLLFSVKNSSLEGK